jgi:hypothetical protein
MNREERLSMLVAELGADVRYATGQRRFPHAIAAEDAAEIAEALAAEVDLGVAARDRAAGDQEIACKRGCSACCEELIMVWQPEALAVARFLDRPENAAAREHFMAAYPEWRDAVGDAPQRQARTFESGNAARVVELHVEHWKRRILCAFNRDGDCTVYPVRPAKCRTAHAVGTSEHCRGDDDSGVPAARLSFAPLDAYVDKARTLLQAAHAALGAPAQRPAALCDSVFALLDRNKARASGSAGVPSGAKIGRNAPCPCGSGKKYKRCCGRT